MLQYSEMDDKYCSNNLAVGLREEDFKIPSYSHANMGGNSRIPGVFPLLKDNDSAFT